MERTIRNAGLHFPAERRLLNPAMSTQELLLEEIKRQPEPVLREVWHYLKFLSRHWASVLLWPLGHGTWSLALVPSFGLRPSGFGFLSDFGFRTSVLIF
jgi:hypothetical protein